METQKPVPRKMSSIVSKNQIAVRNMLIAVAMCLCYLIGKHFQSVQNASAGTDAKISYVKAK